MHTGGLTIKARSHAKSNLLIIGALWEQVLPSAAWWRRQGALIGTAAGAGTGTAYLTGKREVVLRPETLRTFHVKVVTISPKELSRLPTFATFVTRTSHPGLQRPSLGRRRTTR